MVATAQPRTAKALRIMQMIAAGLPVPQTVILYESDIRALEQAWANNTLRHAVEVLYDSKICGLESERIAVRSSYAGEDETGSSLAGSYTSIVDVENKPAALAEALANLLTECQSVCHSRNGVTFFEIIVQAYVPREIHGIAFTVDPQTGNADYTVVSTTISTEDVTGGTADAATVYLRANDGEVDIAWGNSHLADEEALRLLGALQEIQRQYPTWEGFDVEFGFYRGSLYVLQARPITAVELKILVRFHESALSEIAAPFKEIYSRHRRKRHQLYSQLENTAVRFPKSFVIDKNAGHQVARNVINEIATATLLVPRVGIVRPRRKEDFYSIPAVSLEQALSSVRGQHLLVTEDPVAAYSGHITYRGDDLLLEWVDGPLSLLNEDVGVCRCAAGVEWPTHLNVGALKTLVDRITQRFPGAVVEWIQDEWGVVWLYDGTLLSDITAERHSQPKPSGVGRRIVVERAQLNTLRSLTVYPMSVYAEDEEIAAAMRVDLTRVLPQLADHSPFIVEATHPALELATLVLHPGLRGFEVQRGSVLCHLALIARERGLHFAVLEG